MVKPKTRNCASKVNVERGASGSSGWAGRVGREPRAQSRGDWRRPGRADGRTVTREHAGPYTRPDPDPRPARRVSYRLRTRASNANVEVFEPRPGRREGAEVRLFFRGTGEQSRVAAPRASRGKPKTGRERLFASSSFQAMGDSTKNSPLRGRVRGFRGLLPRGRHGVNLACDAVCPMGLSHAIARATTLFAARIGHERYARVPHV